MTWNGQDLKAAIPSLGLTLPTAQLIPEFVRQALDSGLFQDVEHTLLAPLDDLKQWMREDPWREGDLFERVNEALLGEEKKARKASERSGAAFDLVAWELEQMEADDTYDSLPPDWVGEVLKLALEEADALVAWSAKELRGPFALSTSLTLPDPRRHPRFKFEEIASGLKEHDSLGRWSEEGAKAGRATSLELQGAIQLDLARPGDAPVFKRGPEVGFVKVACADPRSGDASHAFLSLAYPLAAEGYFLMTFDALRQGLTLKDA